MGREHFAKEIFEEIRDRPYRGAIYPNTAWNCYFKGIELIGRLATLGYLMRARIGEIHWEDTPLPPNIIALKPKDSLDTHYYPEIWMNDEWKILDPSWNKSFAEKYNLPFSEFGKDNESCFKIIKLYNETEQASYIETWLKKVDSKIVDERTDYTLFINAMNKWLNDVNPE